MVELRSKVEALIDASRSYTEQFILFFLSYKYKLETCLNGA
jgi:hypothetical protein